MGRFTATDDKPLPSILEDIIQIVCIFLSLSETYRFEGEKVHKTSPKTLGIKEL